jgi:tRNA (adenine37-N6)-methyltransferase
VPKVQPPRSDKKRGVFGTRSPHRPNPIGLSVVRLLRIEGLCVYVEDIDLLDGTPLLDIKPYVPYADAFPDAASGWVPHGPERASSTESLSDYAVVADPVVEQAFAWLTTRGVDIEEPLRRALALGPAPHAYRRIKISGDSYLIAHKEWRARFRVEGRVIRVIAITSGYRPQALYGPAAPHDPEADTLELHRKFEAVFGTAPTAAQPPPSKPTRS